MENYNHFVAIVAGENPEELMSKYARDNVKTATIYIKDAETLRLKHIEMAKAYMNGNLNEFERLQLEDIIETLEEQTAEEFWKDYKEEQTIIEEDEDGNIVVEDDSDVMFSSYNVGKNLSMPFITNDGQTSFQERVKNINWERIHLFPLDVEYYERVWEIVMDGDTPKDEKESKIKRTMGNQKDYFSFFGNKETYASHCSAFWAYAFLSEETGWVELSPNKEQIDWVLGYYDNFIETLPENTLLTVYECRK